MVTALITYWIVGLKNEFSSFMEFYFLHVVMSLVGNSMGIWCGCMFSTEKIAVEMAPLMIMPFMLFSGFMVNRESIWVGIRWIEYFSLFKYGLDGFMHN